ncbi:MAG TPA: hypothetical protein VFY85_03935 [Gemmatimonadaceae bacterium]|nr:hypothetical protein [Gemmatimonadaceae bacterium]
MAHAEAPDRLDMARGGAGHPAPARGNVALWTLWFGFLGAPLGWSLQALANTAVASHGCYPSLYPLHAPVTGGMRGILFAISVVAIGLGAAALGMSFSAWRRTNDEHQEKSGEGARRHDRTTAALETGEGRTRFMAMSGVLTSIVFLIVIIAHTAAVFVMTPCGV